MTMAPMLWVEFGAAAYVTWQASCHMNHQSTDTWFFVSAYWTLLGGAAMWSIYGTLSGNPPDPLRMSLVVLVAFGCGFDRRRFDRGLRLRFLLRQRRERNRRGREP